MNKKHFLIISLLTAMLSLTSVSVFGSVLIPSVSLDDYSLIFNTPCDGYTLRLLDEDGVVVYSVVIPTCTTSIVLPSWLSGDYKIELQMGYWKFTGYIML